MTAYVERAVAHFAARRIAGRVLRHAGLMRFLPSGFVATLVAEGLLLAWKELRARPELRKKLWKVLSQPVPYRHGPLYAGHPVLRSNWITRMKRMMIAKAHV